jgi:hypothetical protein
LLALGLEAVALEVDRSPAGFDRVVVGRLAHMHAVCPLARAELGVIALRLDQRDVVGAAAGGGPAEHHDVVLPEADLADVIRAGRLEEDQVPAAGAGVLGGHQVQRYRGRSEGVRPIERE